jgi:hypothetical protein
LRVRFGLFSEVSASYGKVRSDAVNGHRCLGIAGPKSATSGDADGGNSAAAIRISQHRHSISSMVTKIATMLLSSGLR